MMTNSLLSISAFSIELRPDTPTEQPTAQPVPGVAPALVQGAQSPPARPWLGTDFAYTVVARQTADKLSYEEQCA